MSEINNAKEGEASGGLGSATPDFSKLIDKVLSNPEIITTVASALSQMSAEPADKSTLDESAEVEPETAPASASTDSGYDTEAVMKKLPSMLKLLSASAQGVPSDKRSCLLSAIKPYLNPARCEAIDYIIKFSQLSEILRTIN